MKNRIENTSGKKTLLPYPEFITIYFSDYFFGTIFQLPISLRRVEGALLRSFVRAAVVVRLHHACILLMYEVLFQCYHVASISTQYVVSRFEGAFRSHFVCIYSYFAHTAAYEVPGYTEVPVVPPCCCCNWILPFSLLSDDQCVMQMNCELQC